MGLPPREWERRGPSSLIDWEERLRDDARDPPTGKKAVAGRLGMSGGAGWVVRRERAEVGGEVGADFLIGDCRRGADRSYTCVGGSGKKEQQKKEVNERRGGSLTFRAAKKGNAWES